MRNTHMPTASRCSCKDMQRAAGTGEPSAFVLTCSACSSRSATKPFFVFVLAGRSASLGQPTLSTSPRAPIARTVAASTSSTMAGAARSMPCGFARARRCAHAV
eukprot:6423005-Prymnesium_polylepis.1